MNRRTSLTLLFILCIGQAYAQTANFTADITSGCSPLVVSFRDQSTGGPVKWFWDLGNGATSTLQNPASTYISTGTYTITLTVTYANGTTNTQTKAAFITVYDEPTVNFVTDKTVDVFLR